MSIDEITKEVLSLPLDDKESLLSTLAKSVSEERQEEAVDVAGVVRIASAIVGTDILYPRRFRPVIYGRMIASYRLRMYGMGTQEIGDIFGRNHSTITHYCNTLQAYLDLPSVYPDIARYWKELLEIYPL